MYIFFADHQSPFVELGTVFSFEDVISYGSVVVSCAACRGFYMQNVATTTPLRPLSFHYKDLKQLKQLMKSLKYEAATTFEGTDRVEIEITGSRTHVSYEK